MDKAEKIFDISNASLTRYTAGYRACSDQMRDNTRRRVKRKEEALERVKRAFLKAGIALACFALGIGSIWVCEGDITFAVFSVIVGVFFIFEKEGFER